MEEIRRSAWIGDAFRTTPAKAVIVTFHDLGFGGLKNGIGYDEAEWPGRRRADRLSLLWPWSWTNRSGRQLVDALIPSVYREFYVPTDVPLIIVEGSMGGQGALIYTQYSPHFIAGCLA